MSIWNVAPLIDTTVVICTKGTTNDLLTYQSIFWYPSGMVFSWNERQNCELATCTTVMLAWVSRFTKLWLSSSISWKTQATIPTTEEVYDTKRPAIIRVVFTSSVLIAPVWTREDVVAFISKYKAIIGLKSASKFTFLISAQPLLPQSIKGQEQTCFIT